MLERNDELLIYQYLKGEEKSLEVLIKRYLKPIYNFIYHYLGNTTDAEDITQETFFRAWKNLRKFDQQKNFKTWIFSIAKNASIDFLKKKKAIPFSAWENEEGENIIVDTLADPSPLPDELLERSDIAKLLNLALEKITPQYRLILFLHYNDHLTFKEIAEALNKPLNTVKSQHRRALIILKKLLSKLP